MVFGQDNLLKQAAEMQKKFAEVQRTLEAARLIGQAGDQLVTVTVNGLQEVQEVAIAPGLLAPEHQGDLEGLVRQATNTALRMAQELAQKEMARVTGGMNPANLLKGLGG